MFYWTIILASFSIIILSSGAFGDNSTRSDHSLHTQILQLQDELRTLKDLVNSLNNKVESNLADQSAEKVVFNIQANNQPSATKHWQSLLSHTQQVLLVDPDRSTELLHYIVEKAYAGKRSNFYPLLEFILRNDQFHAFPTLYTQLQEHSHFYGGQEVFVLGHYLKEACGVHTDLYQSLPPLVHDVLEGAVVFRNKGNKGFMVAEATVPCNNTQDCYAIPRTEVFIHKGFSTSQEKALLQNPMAHWAFSPPAMSQGFNGSLMESGFHIQSLGQNSSSNFLIVKLRLVTYFFRNQTFNWDPFYEGEMQSQFLPMIAKDVEEDSLLQVGTKAKYNVTPAVEFMFGNKWGKKGNTVGLGRRALLVGKHTKDDYVGTDWEIIPVGTATVAAGVPQDQKNCHF